MKNTQQKSGSMRRSVQRQILNRRTLLRGAMCGGGVALGLPLLDMMLNENGTALAQGQPLPKRFGVYVWGCGIVRPTWIPAQTGMTWSSPAFGDWGADVKPYLTLVTGLNHKDSFPGHIPSRGIVLSSSHDMRLGIQAEFSGGYRGQNMPEPSIDNIVADSWKGKSTIDIVALGVNGVGPYQGNSSWQRGGTAFNRHEMDPVKVFDRLFGAGFPAEAPGTPAISIEQTAAFEKSSLDAVMGEATTLSQRLGSKDRARLEQHLEGFRTLERQIQSRLNGGELASGCQELARPAGGGNMAERGAVMNELIATAMACDVTRVFSYEWSANQSQAIYSGEIAGVENKEHHQMSHDAAEGDGMKKITQYIMKNLAGLAEALRSKPEGDGNLLDNSLIFGTSELANAGAHDYKDHPLVLVGKAGGTIKAGQHWRGQGQEDAPKVLLSAVRAVGVEVPSIGMPEEGRQFSQEIGELFV